MGAVSSAAIATLEMALNRVLGSDADTLQKLSALSGRIVQMEIEGVDTHFYVVITSCGLALNSGRIATADIQIKGTPAALIGLLAGDHEISAVYKQTVIITGDLLLAKKLQTILSASRLDWEELLAQHLGEFPAYALMKYGRYLRKEGGRFWDAMRDNTRDYLQEELCWLPTRIEVENFMSDVDCLRSDAERCHARLQRLLQRI